MILTLQLKLLPTYEQAQQLFATMSAFNAGATYAAKVGFDAGVFSQPSIHKRCYYELREKFGLSSQMAVRAIGKAAECFSRDKKICPIFKPYGAITYDERLMSFKGLATASLLTLYGRVLIPLIYGEYQRQRFDRMKGQCDLVFKDGYFFLYASIKLPEENPIQPTEFLGIDLGIANIATDSDGGSHTGAIIETVRRKHFKQRRALQRCGSKAAKKKIRRIGQKEARFRKHENHVISKKIVTIAKGTKRGIALEDLTHIRSRMTVRRKQRSRQHSWSFAQLRAFITYKAQLAGVPLIIVDPRNTSRTCSQCGHCEKGNRKSQSEFMCLHCGHSSNADLNAAKNIAFLAQAAHVNQP